MELRVLDIQDEDVACEVVRGGRLTERRGVATPGRSPSQPFLGERARRALDFAASHQADFVALSMVTLPQDVAKAREALQARGLDACITSKIERKEALDHFDGILEASDAFMVARGDMGVEVPLSRVPVIQKDLIARSNLSGKPVITATQMLESMVRSPVPTRAEVTDVANAIFDGTDAIMLSGETSVGQYPAEAVMVMAQVATEAEAALPYERIIVEKRGQLEPQTDDAISYNACQTAYQLNASLIVAFTESGSTAGRVAKYRPMPPVLALTPSERVQRSLTLRWGVTPIVVTGINSVDDFFAVGEQKALGFPGVKPGSPVVLVAGLPIGVAGGTNLLRVLTVSAA
jgi:pyruvate kinase